MRSFPRKNANDDIFLKWKGILWALPTSFASPTFMALTVSEQDMKNTYMQILHCRAITHHNTHSYQLEKFIASRCTFSDKGLFGLIKGCWCDVADMAVALQCNACWSCLQNKTIFMVHWDDCGTQPIFKKSVWNFFSLSKKFCIKNEEDNQIKFWYHLSAYCGCVSTASYHYLDWLLVLVLLLYFPFQQIH